MEKIEKLTLENFKQGTYGVYINNVLLVMEIKDIDYEEDVKLVLWLPKGGELIIVGAWSLQEDIKDEDLGGIIEDELHFKETCCDNIVIITSNLDKYY